jgi:hypothetical protein
LIESSFLAGLTATSLTMTLRTTKLWATSGANVVSVQPDGDLRAA